MPSRRHFLKTSSLALGATAFPACDPAPLLPALRSPEGEERVTGEVGVTTGSFMSHITFEPAAGKIRMLDLPKIMHDELDMRVIDLMSRTLESFAPAYLDKLRKAAEDNDCILTNLKCNQKGLDMASPDDETRNQAIKIYKKSIDAAHRLGCRWIRPVLGAGKSPDRNRVADACRTLIDYGAPKNVTLLIENTGWVSRDPDAIPDMIRRVGAGLAASPDTGNWPDDATRYPGLTKAYPLAATSDFKAFQLEPDGTHPKYDLEKCFQTGWDAGFRGPWCIEHFHENLPGLLAGFAAVRDKLGGWIDAKQA